MTVKNPEQLKSLNLITSTESCSISSLIDLDRFSNLQHLLWVTAYVLSFTRHLKARLKDDEQVFQSYISATDLKKAKQCGISDGQRSLWLSKKFECWSREFDLFIDCDGLLRCRDRMSHAELPETSKHPILLDSTHGFTATRGCHERVMHNGVKETLTELRSKFWLVKEKQVGKPVRSAAITPFAWIQSVHSSSIYAGPLYMKGSKK